MNDSLKTNDLDKLAKTLNQKMPYAKVGILGQKADRPGEKNNAEIGAVHEFGEAGMPERSFLRAPISENLSKKMGELKLEKDLSVKDMIYKIGAVAETIVRDAFLSGFDGKWIPSKKEEGRTLVDTTQLMKSISFEVVE